MSDNGFVEARDYRYCPWCGEILVKRTLDGRDRLGCPECEFVWYKNPVPAAGAIIHNGNGILLVRRKYPPGKGDWCIPAGFQEYDESPSECCIREVREETGLEISVEKLFSVHQAGDDPRTMVALILFLGSIKDGELKPGDDAEEVAYFDINNIPSNIAFSAHRTAIAQFREYLSRRKLPEYG